MKRYYSFGIAAAIITLMSAYIAGAAGTPLPVTGSKHDFSFPTGTAPYKAASANPATGGTTQVCVFCHTPHGSSTAAPLWNRKSSLATYTTYTSDVLMGLGYWGAEDPSSGNTHVKTAICLSCHDGTVALGAVANTPSDIPSSFTEIAMGTAKIAPAAAGYIGTNLSDDHPVAIKHDNSAFTGDGELKSPVTGQARLYTMQSGKPVVTQQTNDASGDYVECTSCHNAHDNQYGNFLVESNKNSALCDKCHNKTGFLGSVHADSTKATAAYAPPTGGVLPDTNHGPLVGDVKCMNCHFPHKAGITDVSKLPQADPNATAKAGNYLLSFHEETSCYNNPNRWSPYAANSCHATGGSGKNIESEVPGTKLSRHEVGKYSEQHEAYEARAAGWVGSLPGKWHVECADCHNPHTASNSLHTVTPGRGTITGNTVGSSSPLHGTGGVTKPAAASLTWPVVPYIDGSPPTATGYAYIEPIGVKTTTSTGVSYEYEICYKCHTDFAWNSTSPDSPSMGAGRKMTNQALEFKTNNASYHPVEGATGRNGAGVTFVAPWNANRSTQTMYCADCHTKENDATPSGTHGSTNNAILRSAYTNTYSTTVASKQPNGELCSLCHADSIYNTATTGDATAGTGFWTGTVNLHNRHATIAVTNAPIPSTYAYRCVNCHTRVAHGYKTTGMIVLRGDGFPYEAGATNAGKIATYTPAAGNWSGTKGVDCTTANGCHQ